MIKNKATNKEENLMSTFNQPFYGQNQSWGYNGFQGAPQAMEKTFNSLTQEEIERLQKKENTFSLAITQDEKLRGICTHRRPDGLGDTLVEDPATGLMRCTICGYTFKPADSNTSPEEIRDAVNTVEDFLQTIKLMFIDLPADAAREYFQIIPLLEKIPQLFEYAAKNLAKHNQYGWSYDGRNMSTYNMFANLQGMFGNGMMAQPMAAPQQPMGAPAGFPAGAYQQPMMGNGFGFQGASQVAPGYAPTNQGFAYTPNQATTPAEPTVAAPQAEDVTVATEVKA